MSGRLAGKRILITAAVQGAGRASALICAGEGAQALATDREAGLRADLAALGLTTALLGAPDRDPVARDIGHAGDLDSLFNCAGAVVHGTRESTTQQDWDASFSVNIHPMFRVTRAARCRACRARAEATGSSSIANMASMASSIKGSGNGCA